MIHTSITPDGGPDLLPSDMVSESSSDTCRSATLAESDGLTLAARALFTLGRTCGRQSVRDLMNKESGQAIDLSRVLVAQAVDDGAHAEADEGGADVTVGTVAERLGIDAST